MKRASHDLNIETRVYAFYPGKGIMITAAYD